jgi:transposase InsO family protein
MRTFSIIGIRLRGRVHTTVPDPAASPVPDLFQWDFTVTEPGRKYMGDITYLPLQNGEFLYLATVLDSFSRKVVGWSMANHVRTGLVTDALRMAAATRGRLAKRAASLAAARPPHATRRLRHLPLRAGQPSTSHAQVPVGSAPACSCSYCCLSSLTARC